MHFYLDWHLFFLYELRISNRNCEVRVNFHPTTVTGLKICAFLIQILCLHHKKIDDNLQINMHTYDRYILTKSLQININTFCSIATRISIKCTCTCEFSCADFSKYKTF